LRDARKELAAVASRSVADSIGDLLASAEDVNGTRVIAHVAQGATREMLRDFVDQLRSKAESVAILLGCEIDGKVALIAAVSKDLVAKKITANDAIKAAAPKVGGGGGGRPDMAEAGGKNPAGLPDAIEAAKAFFR